MYPPELTRGQKIGIAVAVTVVVILIAVTIILMLRHPEFTESVRDISLIILALTVIVIDVILVVLVWQILKLLSYLTNELGPIVQSLQETAGTVRGTTTFLSDSVVNPTIGAVSKVSGARRSLAVLFGVADDFRGKQAMPPGGNNDGQE